MVSSLQKMENNTFLSSNGRKHLKIRDTYLEILLNSRSSKHVVNDVRLLAELNLLKQFNV